MFGKEKPFSCKQNHQLAEYSYAYVIEYGTNWKTKKDPMMKKFFLLAFPVALAVCSMARLLPLQSDFLKGFLEGISLVFMVSGALYTIIYAITKKDPLSRFCRKQG